MSSNCFRRFTQTLVKHWPRSDRHSRLTIARRIRPSAGLLLRCSARDRDSRGERLVLLTKHLIALIMFVCWKQTVAGKPRTFSINWGETRPQAVCVHERGSYLCDRVLDLFSSARGNVAGVYIYIYIYIWPVSRSLCYFERKWPWVAWVVLVWVVLSQCSLHLSVSLRCELGQQTETKTSCGNLKLPSVLIQYICALCDISVAHSSCVPARQNAAFETKVGKLVLKREKRRYISNKFRPYFVLPKIKQGGFVYFGKCNRSAFFVSIF